ncbi:hypothetical protein HN51_065468 [Arachis hypogaea]|nr:probable WRKY transcription factor 4 [Arachis hypogaea]QHO06615.1 putative WRKY transcription factor [Arachis hypogaea]
MEGKNTPPLSSLSSPPQIFSPPSPPFSLSIPTTTIDDLNFLDDDTFLENPLPDLVKEGDFGPLYEWLGITDEDAPPVERPVKRSLPPDAIVPESFETVAQSESSSFFSIPSNPDVAVSNNNNSSRVAGKRPAESVAGDGGNASPRSDEPDDEKVNTITRLKLKPSTMTSIAATMRLNRRSENNIPKLAFLTESESDNLEDGYKWRKYGRKTVRNSPYPRNYYRCTAIGCNVKKRVERWLDDPTHVLTTYEGLHLHGLPPIPPTPSKSFHLYNNCTTGPKPDRCSCSCRCKGAVAVAGAGEQNRANNAITSVHLGTVSGGSGVNDGGSLRIVAGENEFNYNKHMQNVEQAITPIILQNFMLSAPQTSLNNFTPMTIINNGHYQSSLMNVHHDGNNHRQDCFGAGSSNGGAEDLFRNKSTGTGLLEDIVNFS